MLSLNINRGDEMKHLLIDYRGNLGEKYNNDIDLDLDKIDSITVMKEIELLKQYFKVIHEDVNYGCCIIEDCNKDIPSF